MAPQFAQFVANVAEKLDGFTGRDKGMPAAADEPPASSLEYGLIEERPRSSSGSAVSFGGSFKVVMLMAASVGAVLCVPLFLSSSAFTSLGSTASQTEWHGVSLGGWLLMEVNPAKRTADDAMDLRPFWMFDQFEAPSELDFITQLRQEHGDAYAITTMQNHWDRYISDTQLDEAQKLGINAVRIPVGYWIMDSPAAGSGKGGAFKGSPLEYGISPEGFVTGGLNHLRSMLIKLKQRKMVALVDVHSLPCNSGCISDGMSCKAPLAFGNPDGTPAAIADMPRCYGGFYKTTRTASASESSWGDVGVNSVAALAAWLAALPDEAQSVCAFQLANEPALGPPGIYDDAVAEFYARAHAKVRSHLPSTPLIFSFMGPSPSAIKLLKESNSKASVTAEKGGAGLPAEVLADHHYYLNWQSPVGEDLPWDEIHRRACVREAEGAAHAVDFYAENSLPLIVGEWSLAVNHDIKHDLTDKKVVENLSKLFKEQVYAFTTLPEIRGHFFWTLRMGSGWDPRPSDGYPKGKQLEGTSAWKSLEEYPFAVWSLLEMAAVGVAANFKGNYAELCESAFKLDAAGQ